MLFKVPRPRVIPAVVTATSGKTTFLTVQYRQSYMGKPILGARPRSIPPGNLSSTWQLSQSHDGSLMQQNRDHLSVHLLHVDDCNQINTIKPSVSSIV